MICACGDELLFTASGAELKTLLEKVRCIKGRWDTEGAELVSKARETWQALIEERSRPVEYHNPLPEALREWEALPWYVRLIARKPTQHSHPCVPVPQDKNRLPSTQTQTQMQAVMEFGTALSLLLKELEVLDIRNATFVRKGELDHADLLPHRILSVNEFLPFQDLLKALNLRIMLKHDA